MKDIHLSNIPDNIEGFIALRDNLANSPEGGAAIFVLAMILFERDRTLGEQAFTIALDRYNLVESMTGYKGFAPAQNIRYHLDRFDEKPYWGRAYIEGTSPQGAYVLPTELIVSVGRNDYSEQHNGDIKVFIKCSGADSPRPITMRVNDKGIWKAFECSSMFLGMRAPEDKVSDDL